MNLLLETFTFTEREYMLLGINMLTNSLKTSDTTKTKFLEVKLFQSDKKR